MCERGQREMDADEEAVMSKKSQFLQEKHKFETREASLRSRFQRLERELDIIAKVKGLLGTRFVNALGCMS
jgi:hypothetical protein